MNHAPIAAKPPRPAAQVFGSPHEPYTRDLLAAVPTLEPGWLDRKLG